MTIAIIVLSIFLIISIAINVWFLRWILQYIDKRDELIEIIESSLDTINDCYANIAHIAEMPVFVDEPQVRVFINNVRMTQHVLLQIAREIASFGSEQDTEQ